MLRKGGSGSEQELEFQYRQNDKVVRQTIVRMIAAHLQPAWAQNHVGVDLSTGTGRGTGGSVIAPTALRITGFNDPDGCVIVKEAGADPDFGFAFCHLASYTVEVGEILQRGDIIGIEGNRAQLGKVAIHLHFEMYRPEAPEVVYPYQRWNLDPEPILKEKGAWF